MSSFDIFASRTARAKWRALLAATAFVSTLGGGLLRAGEPLELQKLELPGATYYDRFGFAVAIDGQVAVAGAYLDDTAGGTDAGSAEVFRFNAASGQWLPEQQLFASDGAASDGFGVSVAVSGNVIAVGAYLDDTATGADTGSVYIYRYNGSTWVEEQRITSSGATGDQFGRSVGLSGDFLIVGAPEDDTAAGTDSGAVYFYKYRGVVLKWAFDGSKNGEAASDYFGFSVGIDGNVAVAGAYARNTASGADAGSAYVFRNNGTAWNLETVLAASDGAAGDGFGVSVGVSGDVIAVGAYLDNNSNGDDAGSAYVFRHSGNNWIEEDHLFAADGSQGDHFARGIGIDGNVIVVGADYDDAPTPDCGSAYLYRHVGAACGWVQDHHLLGRSTAAYDYMGTSVAVGNGYALVGVYLDDTTGNYDAGTVNVYGTAEVALDIQPHTVAAGQDITFTTGYGDNNELFMLAVTVPFKFFFLTYGSDARSVLTTQVPTGIPPGVTLTFQAFELIECANRAEGSNQVSVTFQ
jgi:uncharacterized protein (DUF2147 family)